MLTTGPTPSLSDGYRWGKIQGWILLLLGLLLFLPAPFVKSPVLLIAGAWFMVMGVGIIGRKKYGVVLLYVQVILTYAAGYTDLPYPETKFARWVLLLFLVIPASFYYPKRWDGLR